MLINPFKLKRIIALLLMSIVSVVSFYVGIMFYGFWTAIIIWLLTTFVFIPITSLILKNPFTTMLEGKGLLVLNMDSTGIIEPFIVGLNQPFIMGKYKGQEIKDVFDRKATFHISKPTKLNKSAQITKEGGLKLELTNEELNKARFAFGQYPVLIWNDMIKSLLTKDFIAEKERSFIEHPLLFMNEQLRELNKNILAFGRYVVETTRPIKEFFAKNKWVVWLIIILLLLGLGIYLFPKIMPAFQHSISAGSSAISQVKSSTITPR